MGGMVHTVLASFGKAPTLTPALPRSRRHVKRVVAYISRNLLNASGCQVQPPARGGLRAARALTKNTTTIAVDSLIYQIHARARKGCPSPPPEYQGRG